MGQLFSCPLGDLEDLDFDAVLVRSISFQDGEMRNPLRSVSFNGRDSEPAAGKSYNSHRMRFERPIATRTRELETVFSFKTPSAEMENSEFGRSTVGPKNYDQFMTPRNSGQSYSTPRYSEAPRHEHYNAAVKLQKVYKSFRTRRQLADCAVLVEQRWWKLLDFAELKRSSISFFDIEKPETAISRWSRARTRAAKVGKGLSKDEKARKLALQHWLEAIDPRHRYGHNLQFYYVKWLHCDSKQPFFYWLDIGEGKEVNLERCPRHRLHQQCIKYLGPVSPSISEISLQIPERSNVFDIFKKETLPASCRALIPDSPSDDGYETAEESFLSEEEFMVPKSNLFGEDEEDNDDQPIQKEKILRRIVSHKEMKSYQLAKQLSSRWTTGAGPRIGCMRDYPQELQNKVLEQANLSPRDRVVHASHSRTQSRIGSMASTPISCKDTSTTRSPLSSNCLILSQTATPCPFSQLWRIHILYS